ncbi:hypothetical protein CRG98_041350 [Punica granatum]|uniref:Uncharacterized protein n=1 Tax=Punica granatum TaxID=22663 RepID=A0A2I0I2Q0_PUNGR|nr:hypothetical protein CRG98_041350 [Punica granatum]
MDEENVHQVPRGLTLEQTQFLGLQRGQEELSARLDVVIQALDRMAVVPAPPQRAHRVPRRNVRVEDEADLEDELLEISILDDPGFDSILLLLGSATKSTGFASFWYQSIGSKLRFHLSLFFPCSLFWNF